LQVSSSRARSLLFVALALFLGATGCGPGSRLIVPDQLTDADLRLGFSSGKNRDNGDFAEQLVVRGKLSDGGSLYSKLTVANIANADGRADFNIDLKLADGRRAKYRVKKDKDDWTYSSDRFSAEVGNARVELAVGRCTITVDDDAFKLEVVIQTDLPAVRPPGGVFDSGGAFYITTLPIPRGRVSITLEVREPLERTVAPEGTDVEAEVEGEDGATADPTEDPVPEDEGPEVIELGGIGYVEHRAGNLPPYRLAHAWFNVLQIGDDTTLVMSAFEKKRAPGSLAKDHGRARGWLIVATDDELVFYEPTVDVWVRGQSPDEVTGYSLPELVYLADPDRRLFKGVIKTGPMSKRKDDLSNLKKLERLVVRRLMKPWTFTYNHAQYLFRRQVPGDPSVEHRGTGRFLYQQLDE
jgi:hypothetical protein